MHRQGPAPGTIYIPDKSTYKWIDRYLASLDADKDWEEIIRTFSNYNTNDFAMNLVYSASTLITTTTPQGAAAVFHAGKAVHKKQKRFEENLNFFSLVFEHGPRSDVYTENVRRVNALHMRIAKRHPGSFDDADDFIEICTLVAITAHLVMQKLGLPGYPHHLQRAWYHFSKAMYAGFMTVNGPVPLDRYPADFDGLIQFHESYVHRPHPETEYTKVVGGAFAQQFEERWFPYGLRWLGRQFLLFVLDDATVEHFGLGVQNMFMAALLRRVGWFLFRLHDVLPDPKTGRFDKKHMDQEKRVVF